QFMDGKAGDVVSFEFPGGQDIGPFSGSIPTLGLMHVLTPVLTQREYGLGVSLNFNHDLTVQWNTDNHGEAVLISITVDNGDDIPKICDCRVRDDVILSFPPNTSSPSPLMESITMVFRWNAKRLHSLTCHSLMADMLPSVSARPPALARLRIISTTGLGRIYTVH
nr:hypothetical protein [Candidatus Hydrogenedentota bacterium]